MRIDIFRVTGLEYEFRREPESKVNHAYGLRRLIITTSAGERIELAMFSEPDSTPAWPKETQP